MTRPPSLPALSLALALALAPAARATIVSDGGLPCIFNPTGVNPTSAQLGAGVALPPASFLGTALGCSSQAVPTSASATPWPLSSASWCLVDQSRCPGGAPPCGTLFSGFGYVDACDNAYLNFGVVPNTQVLNPATQGAGAGAAAAYTFYVGQQLSVFVPGTQLYVQPDELIRITIGPNPTAYSNPALTSNSGLNFTSSASGHYSFTVASSWGLGSGLQVFAGPGSRTPGQGVAPGCTAANLPPGATSCPASSSSPSSTVSGGIVSVANYSGASGTLVVGDSPPTSSSLLPGGGITILPSYILDVDVFDPATGAGAGSYQSLNGGLVALSTSISSIVYTATGGATLGSPSFSLLLNATSSMCGGGGSSSSCVTIGGTQYLPSFGPVSYPSTPVLNANTLASGTALNVSFNLPLLTAPCTGYRCTTLTAATVLGSSWRVGVTVGGITNYSQHAFVFYQPASPSPSVSASPSRTPTVSTTSTVSASNVPSYSPPPNYAAVISSNAAANTGPLVGGIVGGVFALVAVGAGGYALHARRVRHAARVRMRSSSRRFMGSQESAYGRVRQDGVVNVRAEGGGDVPSLEVRRPQKQEGGGEARGDRRAARNNSLTR